MAIDPHVVRSQRNKERRPAPVVPAATANLPNVEAISLEAGGGLEYGAQSKLRLVRPRHYLGYISTSYAHLVEMRW
jgi:hypothetical protein